MELNITEFFNNSNAFDYSASIAEMGDNVGIATWQNACNADFVLLSNDDECESFRQYIKGFGAWSDEEIAAWDNNELNALCIQFVSGEIRQFEDVADSDWEEYERLSEEGQLGGLCKGGDDQVYIYLSE